MIVGGLLLVGGVSMFYGSLRIKPVGYSVLAFMGALLLFGLGLAFVGGAAQ